MYQGQCTACPYLQTDFTLYIIQGRDAETGRKVAIKKIKVGQFKDGLDMSAIREVKYLREVQHQNVITVCVLPVSRLCVT